jgi:tetratricopeptide (TPR) repeat protein
MARSRRVGCGAIPGRPISLWQYRTPLLLCTLLSLFVSIRVFAQNIPADEIAELREELAEAGKSSSSTRQRRALKGIIRDAEKLIRAHDKAPNRFEVLGVMLETQKRLVGMDSSPATMAELFKISKDLAAAPDEYADIRIEADMLLSERELSRKDATVEERASALESLLQRYRGTPGEAKSLMIGFKIAPQLEAFELEKMILEAFDERFSGDHDLLLWRRKQQGYQHYRMLFTGKYTRADGTELVFPIDGTGHTCLLFFWSKDTPETEAEFAKLKDIQERLPGHFNVFSFNLDGLPDAGEKILRERGLEAIPMHLPGRRENKAYKVYAARDPFVIRVNAHGHAFSPTELITEELKERPMEENFDTPRYLAQIRYLLDGGFLVGMPGAPGEVPGDTLSAIESCWAAPPSRYRLTDAEVMGNYQKALELCDAAIQLHSSAQDFWRVRNLKVLALLGMWKLGLEPKYLEAAVAESKVVLAGKLPKGADLVPRFCLAKQELRKNSHLDWTPIRTLLANYRETEIPPRAYALAAMLAMEVNAKELFEGYRANLLAMENHEPWMWPVLSFLSDQGHQYRLFKSNFYLPPSLARRIERATLRTVAIDQDRMESPNLKLDAEFQTLSGESIRIQGESVGKTTLLVFVEPPPDPSANFPRAIKGEVTVDDRGRKREFIGAMQRAFALADENLNKDIRLVATFLSEDAGRVKSLMETNQWECEAVLVPGGLSHPVVRKFGILSADRVPNFLLLKPDGTLAWKLSGIVHPQVRAEGEGELVGIVEQSLKWNILKLDLESSLHQFANNGPMPLFSEPYPAPSKPSPDAWTPLRHHGRAATLFRQGKFEEALVEVDAAIQVHELVLNRTKPCSCQSVATLLQLKSTILAKLGKAEEAKATAERAKGATFLHSTKYYRKFHQRLAQMTNE